MSRPGTAEPATAVAAARPAEPLPLGARLLVVSGPDRGRSMLLQGDHWLVGQGEACHLILTDPMVSRQHLELRRDDHGLSVRDLESRNGSFFEGTRFHSLRARLGAHFVVGETELVITVAEDGAATLSSGAASQLGALVAVSDVMRRLFATVTQVASSSAAVLLHGETGTGKELLAEAIHQLSPRQHKPFVVCDLASLTSSLVESELFGHIRGAFTGADRDRTGAFAEADGGTIFLDEIGELPLELQPRLLRVLERRQIKPVGASRYRDVDLRVVCATNRDLAAEVRAGTFRRDLYYRLAIVNLEVPPLRSRPEDVGFLVEHFVAQLTAGRTAPAPRVSPAALAALSAHDWPGNVRELRNVIEQALAVAPQATTLDRQLLGIDRSTLPTANELTAAEPPAVIPFKEAKESLIQAWEREYLIDLLARAGQNVSEAARRAGIARVYMHGLMKKHGLLRS